MESFTSLGPFSWMDKSCKILSTWFDKKIPAGDELVRSSGEGFSHGYIFPWSGPRCALIIYTPSSFIHSHRWSRERFVSSLLGVAKLPWCIARSAAYLCPRAILECWTWRYIEILYNCFFWIWCVHRMMGMAPPGRRMLKKHFCLSGACTWLRGKDTFCSKASTPSIISTVRHWRFFLRDKLVFLRSCSCRSWHYIECWWGSIYDDLIKLLGPTRG